MIDWSRRKTAADREAEREEREQRQAERENARNWRPRNGQLQKRIEELEDQVQRLTRALP